MNNAYDGYQNYYLSNTNSSNVDYFADSLCVTDTTDLNVENASYSYAAEAAGVFNVSTGTVSYARNVHEQLYPASTTKILTAYIIIKYCDLNALVTVSDHAVDQPSDSSTCGLNAGDVTTVENLLYGLMLPSGNDAAIALAEYYSGSEEAFAEVMNAEALALGATNSHFVNPNGLSDSEHYTSVYDMYLIFNEAIKYDVFKQIISTKTKTVYYSDIMGSGVEYTYTNTNKYINGGNDAPSGVTVIGGKTGTTGAAGYCLVLYSVNSRGEDIISIVFKSDTRSDLYDLMDQLLYVFAN